MNGDFKASKFWREEDIARVASGHRWSAPSALHANFSVVSFFEMDLERTFKRGHVTLELSDLVGKGDFPACVKFTPLRLICDSEVWKYASLGESEAKYIVAHEFGHLFLHSGYEYHFSDPANVLKKWYMEEESTEWQAHAYARNFLLPDFIVKEFDNFTELALACNVTEDLAERRFKEANSRRMIGEACSTCHNFTLFRSGIVDVCSTCGKKEGVHL